MFPDILKSASLLESASPAAASRPDYPVILCIDVPLVLLDGSAQSRGAGPGSQANGSFPKGTGRLSEKSPAGYPPPHHRDAPPGSAGVPPACCPFGCRSVSLRCCSRPPCRREPHGPGRSRGRAPLPVDSGGGDGRSCGRICAGGTPALPGGLPPMTGSHQRDKREGGLLFRQRPSPGFRGKWQDANPLTPTKVGTPARQDADTHQVDSGQRNSC